MRVHGGDVAVHADAGHEGHADVNVGEVKRARDAAHGVSKHPDAVVEMIVDTKGQGAQKERVGHGEVNDVHVGGRLLFYFEYKVIQSSQISQQSKNQYQGVHWWEKIVLESQ